MSDELVLCEGGEGQGGPVVTVTINRPKALNALNGATVQALLDAIRDLGQRPHLRCVILTGAGEKAFVAGADIKAMEAMTPAEALRFAELGHAIGEAIETLPVPVIAAVNGFALGGGCELALACDFIHASETASFGQPEVNLGVIPGFGGTQRLARRVGLGLARELVYTGRVIDAGEALRIGLVNGVHPAAELLTRVRAIADTIVTRGPRAVSAAKDVLLRGADRPLGEANEIERQAFAGLFASSDQREGMRAFIEKRAPKWSNG